MLGPAADRAQKDNLNRPAGATAGRRGREHPAPHFAGGV